MKTLLTSLLLLIVVFVATAAPAAAFNPFSGVNCSQAQDSAVCADNKPLPIAGPNSLLIKITRIIAVIAGIAAIVIILLSGLRYITSSGDPKNVESAKNTLIGAVIGLAVIVAAQAIITFVVAQL